MTRAIEIADALGRLERLVGRTHETTDGETELTILADPPITLALRAGMFAVVPRGHWHRFRAPDGVSTLTVTPPPTDHHHSEDPPPAETDRLG